MSSPHPTLCPPSTRNSPPIPTSPSASRPSCRHCPPSDHPPIYPGARPLSSRISTWNPCCDCLFSALPDALIYKSILPCLDFNSLSTARLVSTRWNFNCDRPSLWSKVRVHANHPLPPPSSLSRHPIHHFKLCDDDELQVASPRSPASRLLISLQPQPELQALDVSGATSLDLNCLISSLQVASHRLTSLSLGRTLLTDEHLTLILALTGARLKYLDLNSCPLLTDAPFMDLNCPCLTFLSLSGCSRVTCTGIMPAVRGSSPSLTRLQLRGVAHVCSALFKFIAVTATQLRLLDIGSRNALGIAGSSCSVTAAEVQVVTSAASRLEVLALAGRFRLEDVPLSLALQSCASLTRLDLRGCRLVGSSTLRALGEHCPVLTDLNLSHCTAVRDDDLKGLHPLAALRSLDITSCNALNLKPVADAAHACTALTRMHVGAIPSLVQLRVDRADGDLKAAFPPRVTLSFT